MHVLLDHMLIARIRLTYGHMRALDVRRTIHTYIYIYIYIGKILPLNSLVWDSLTLTPIIHEVS